MSYVARPTIMAFSTVTCKTIRNITMEMPQLLSSVLKTSKLALFYTFESLKIQIQLALLKLMRAIMILS